uniref:Uncharacterized protein n=1 Tax=Oryza meridionalis TaxID=40149 RepID=A0A0E0ECC9_9ORYZ
MAQKAHHQPMRPNYPKLISRTQAGASSTHVSLLPPVAPAAPGGRATASSPGPLRRLAWSTGGGTVRRPASFAGGDRGKRSSVAISGLRLCPE